MSRHILLFVVATLGPLALTGIGAVLGGYWVLAALAWLTVGVRLSDALIPAAPSEPITARDRQQAGRLVVSLGLLHFAALALALHALTGGTDLGFWAWLGTFAAFMLWFGQISAATAHDLIHRRNALLFHLGAAIHVSLLFGHHISAHRHVHHRFAATADDPYSADSGDSFYDYLGYAWLRGFEAGFDMDRAMMKPRMGSKGRLIHPYMLHVTGSAFALFLSMLFFGIAGPLVLVLLAVAAQVQILLAEYVLHYGLSRRKQSDGRIERFTPRHAWNARQVVSGHMLLHGTRHSDHHMHPTRPFATLRLPLDGRVPVLPHSLQVMCLLALAPPLFDQVMGPALRDHQARIARRNPAVVPHLPAKVPPTPQATVAPRPRIAQRRRSA